MLDLSANGEIAMDLIINKAGNCGMYSSDLAQESVVTGSCKEANGSSGSLLTQQFVASQE